MNKKSNIIARLSLFAFQLITYSLLLTTVVSASDWDDYQKSGHKNSKWDSYVEAGFSSFENGNVGTAEMFLQRAVARGCNDGLVYTKIGFYYEAQKNYKKAINYLKKAYQKLPVQYPNAENTKLMDESLGRNLFLAGNANAAEPYLQKAVDKKESFMSLYILGQIIRTKGGYEKAIELFERALKSDRPKDIPPAIDILIMTEIAKAQYELKNYDASLEWWNKVLSMNPMNQTAQSYKTNIEQQKFKEQEQKSMEEILQ